MITIKHRSVGDTYLKDWLIPPSTFSYAELNRSINDSSYSIDISDFIPCSQMRFSFDVKSFPEHNDYIVIINDIETNISLKVGIAKKYHDFPTVREIIDFLYIVDMMDEVPKFY